MKGIVLEVKEDEAIVLSKDGTFQVVKRKYGEPLSVGDEVEIPAFHEHVQNKKWFGYPTFALMVSCFVILLAAIGAVVMWPDNTAVAYVNFDLNPSVELSVNRSMEVLSLVGMNHEGKELVQYMTDWSHHSLHNVLVNMLITAQDQGYLRDVTNILVTTTSTGNHSIEEYDSLIVQALQKAEAQLRESEAFYVYGNPASGEPGHPSKNNRIVFYRLKAAPEVREQAQQAGVPLGRYILYRYAEQQGYQLPLEKIQNLSITELAKELGELDPLLVQPVSF